MRLLTVLSGLVLLSSTALADAGRINWFDLITEDAEAAKAFYGDLFGWTFNAESPEYSVALHEGREIAGIAEIRGREKELSEDLWLAAIEVDDLPLDPAF